MRASGDRPYLVDGHLVLKLRRHRTAELEDARTVSIDRLQDSVARSAVTRSRRIQNVDLHASCYSRVDAGVVRGEGYRQRHGTYE